MSPVQALFCCLESVTQASGSDGIDPQALKWTHDYRNAFRAHSVTPALAMASIGIDLSRYFGVGANLDDADKRDMRDFAIQQAQSLGFNGVNFQMDLALDTTLGTMSVTMYQQNGGPL